MTSLTQRSLSGKQVFRHLCLNVSISFTTLGHQIRHLLKVLFHLVSLQFLLHGKR